MKLNFLKQFLLPILIFTSISITAQEVKKKPYHLTHEMTPEEKLRADEIGKNFYETDPPTGEVRNIAEWEPMEAVLITYDGYWEFGIPCDLIAEMSEDCIVTTIVANQTEENTVISYFTANGVNLINCDFIHAPVDSWWSRDYSPWYIAVDNSEVSIINFPYNRPRPNDNDIPIEMAAFLSIPLYGMDVIHTGGNYMCDGYGAAVSTDLVLEEETQTQTQIEQKMFDYLGIETYHIRPDPQDEYIKHIDCWAKFIDVDKIIITEVPASDDRYADYETAAAYFSEQNCSYGYPYQVFRVQSADYYDYDTNPYTNSLVLNNKVFVPQTGSGLDDDAIAVYQEAMPGYEIIGVYSSDWYNTDALHCRTHGVADREMLYLKHYPLFGIVNSDNGYTVSADIHSYGGYDLSEVPKLHYSVDGGAYEIIDMGIPVKANTYSATIPEQSQGSEITYYISASDISGNAVSHPFIGEADPHIFTAGEETVGINNISENDDLYFNIYPNPSEGNFFVWTNLEEKGEIQVSIFSLTGQTVFENRFFVNEGGDLQNINIIGIASGVYQMTIHSTNKTASRRLIIK